MTLPAQAVTVQQQIPQQQVQFVQPAQSQQLQFVQQAPGQQVIMHQQPIQTQHVVAARGQVLVAAAPGTPAGATMMTTVNGQQLYAVPTSTLGHSVQLLQQQQPPQTITTAAQLPQHPTTAAAIAAAVPQQLRPELGQQAPQKTIIVR